MSRDSWYKIRTAVLVTVAVGLFLFVTNTQAQNARQKTFPLHKEFIATVAVCSNEKYATDVAEGGAEVFSFLAQMGACAGGETKVKYLRLVYTSKDGKSRVYEIEIAGHKVFSITDWRPESI